VNAHATLRPFSTIILIVGVILLIFTSFGGLQIDLRIQVLFLSLGILLSNFTERENQDTRTTLPAGVSVILLVVLVLGIAYASYLLVTGMEHVQWDEIYYFSSETVPQLQAGDYGFPNYDFLLGIIFSIILSAIFIISWIPSRYTTS
jgi:ABC-type uncharacterized transport system permease subunit